MSDDPNFLSPLKFYPVKGSTQRKAGEGCTSCIHQHYCQDFYWLRRNLEYKLSPDYGTSCASWSNRHEDYVQGATTGDLQLIERWKYMGIAGEKDECGIELES